MRRVSGADLGRIFGVSKARITQLKNEGALICGEDGKFSVSEAEDHFGRKAGRTNEAERKAKAAAGSTAKAKPSEKLPSGEISLAELKRQVEKEKLVGMEFKNKLIASELIDLASVEQAVFTIGKKLQTKMVGWKPRFLAHMTDKGKETVHSEIITLIEEIIEDLGKVADVNPEPTE